MPVGSRIHSSEVSQTSESCSFLTRCSPTAKPEPRTTVRMPDLRRSNRLLQLVSKSRSSALGGQSPPSLTRGFARSPSLRLRRLLGLTPTAGGRLKPVLRPDPELH